MRSGVRLEQLERRDLLAIGDLPFGAMPDDTGEYMLGDVRVNVVFMESDPTKVKANGSPADTSPISYNLPTNPPTSANVNFTAENWSNWTQTALDNLRGKIASGLAWWEQTLHNKFPKAPADALRFSIDWHYADSPVSTAYEPIARISDDFQYWIYDFLSQAGFDSRAQSTNLTGNFSADVRAYNNFTRQQSNSDWAFTIFVVNDLNDSNDRFTQFSNLGSFSQAFAFAGGQFMVVPASRPFESFAHETGHMFWALDEYLDNDDWVFVPTPAPGHWEKTQVPDEYLEHRGYYNTQNLNAADNPTAGFVQDDSIMSADDPLNNKFPMSRARDNHTSSRTTLEMIGWKDSDNDGIMDVLDMPLSLTGSGQYDINSGIYYFNGLTKVRTLPNQNPAGLRNDITINQIRAIEYSVDGGVTWQRHSQTFAPRTYETAFNISFPVPDGQTTVKIRSVDMRTGVKSNEFTGITDGPAPASPGVSGFVFSDDDGDGSWDAGEAPLPDYGIDVLDESGQQLDLLRWIEPSEFNPLEVVQADGATLSAVGSDTGSDKSVVAIATNLATAAGGVFGTTNNINQYVATWTADRRLRVDFGQLQSNVSLHAYGGAAGSTFARLEAYDAGGNLLERITSSALSPNTLKLLALNRPSADISYIVAYGHANTSAIFDTLEWGPASSTTSDALGAYSLNTLPDGVYQVQVTPPSPSHEITTPPGGVAFVTISGGMSSGNVNFGVHIQSGAGPRFHNQANPLNVSNDAANVISAFDAVLIINWLNAHPGQSSIDQTSDPEVIGYIDVDGNNGCSPADAIEVINYLNSPAAAPPPPGGEGAGEATAQASAQSATAGAGSGDAGQPSVQLASSLAEKNQAASGLAIIQASSETAARAGLSALTSRFASEHSTQSALASDALASDTERLAERHSACAGDGKTLDSTALSRQQLIDAVDAIFADGSPGEPLPQRLLQLLTAKGR